MYPQGFAHFRLNSTSKSNSPHLFRILVWSSSWKKCAKCGVGGREVRELRKKRAILGSLEWCFLFGRNVFGWWLIDVFYQMIDEALTFESGVPVYIGSRLEWLIISFQHNTEVPQSQFKGQNTHVVAVYFHQLLKPFNSKAVKFSRNSPQNLIHMETLDRTWTLRLAVWLELVSFDSSRETYSLLA